MAMSGPGTKYAIATTPTKPSQLMSIRRSWHTFLRRCTTSRCSAARKTLEWFGLLEVKEIGRHDDGRAEDDDRRARQQELLLRHLTVGKVWP